MELDLETFLTALYVIVDDLYHSHVVPHMPAHGGPPPRMSDSEVLCLAIAAQMFSGRAGQPRLQGPFDHRSGYPQVEPPSEWLPPLPTYGRASHKPMIGESGFRGDGWLHHWFRSYGVHVVPVAKQGWGGKHTWWSAARQVVETTFANLTEHFGLKYPGAHSRWGLVARVAAKVAAYNLGILINRLFGRPDFAFGTLIV